MTKNAKVVYVICTIACFAIFVNLALNWEWVKHKSSSPTLTSYMLINSRLQEESEGIRIDSLKKLKTIDGKIISLSEAIKNKKKLICRYSEISCYNCISDDLELLNKLGERIGYENVIYLTNFDNFKNMIILKNQNKCNFAFYNLEKEQLNSPIDSLNISYFFLLDETYKKSFFFIPMNNMKKYTQQYFDLIAEEFHK